MNYKMNCFDLCWNNFLKLKTFGFEALAHALKSIRRIEIKDFKSLVQISTPDFRSRFKSFKTGSNLKKRGHLIISKSNKSKSGHIVSI